MKCDKCKILLDATLSCPRCGVYHGDPCGSCGRGGYHKRGCAERKTRKNPKAWTEHEEKCEALAQRYGVAALLRKMPVSAAKIVAALAAGDEHLNTIALRLWDRAAGVTSREGSKDWPYPELRASARFHPWSKIPTSSLSDRVAVLKHVAKYHYIGATKVRS